MQNPELELQYKSCYARILDAKRRFLEAATRYYDLSQSSSSAADGPQATCLLLSPVDFAYNERGQSCSMTCYRAAAATGGPSLALSWVSQMCMTSISTPEVGISNFGMLGIPGRYLWACCI